MREDTSPATEDGPCDLLITYPEPHPAAKPHTSRKKWHGWGKGRSPGRGPVGTTAAAAPEAAEGGGSSSWKTVEHAEDPNAMDFYI